MLPGLAVAMRSRAASLMASIQERPTATQVRHPGIVRANRLEGGA